MDEKRLHNAILIYLNFEKCCITYGFSNIMLHKIVPCGSKIYIVLIHKD